MPTEQQLDQHREMISGLNNTVKRSLVVKAVSKLCCFLASLAATSDLSKALETDIEKLAEKLFSG